MPTEIDNLQGFLSDPLRRIVAHLGTAVVAGLSDTPSIANMVEATFPGYAPVPLTEFTPDETSADDLATQIADACEFTAGDIVTPQTVTVLYVTMTYDGGDPVLLQMFPLDPALTFEKPGHQFSRNVRFWSMQDV